MNAILPILPAIHQQKQKNKVWITKKCTRVTPNLVDKRVECLLFLLFMYAFYLLPQNGILSIFFYRILWFLPFFNLQYSLSWSGYLEMFIYNGFLHGVFQGFSMFFNVLFQLVFRNFSFSGASILRSISWWQIVTNIFAINSSIYFFSQGMYVLSITDLSIAEMLYNGHLVITDIF